MADLSSLPPDEQDRILAEMMHKSHLAGFDATVKFAEITIKTIVLVNGAAAIALLAFLGHVVAAATSATKNGVQTYPVKLEVATQLMPSMGCFMSGVAAGVITAILAYFTQIAFSETGRSQWGQCLRRIAVLFAVTGIGCFIAGGYTAVTTFTDALTP